MLKRCLFFVHVAFFLMTSCSQGERIVVDVAQPLLQNACHKCVIVIDPGHGGFDIGARVQRVKEKVLALQTANLVKKHLHSKGYRVVLTRSRDVFVPLERRSAIANATKGHLFVSIHFNAFKRVHVKGVEVYYYDKGPKWRQVASKKLAQIVLNKMVCATHAFSRGIKPGNFHVVRETQMPAILVEGGFLTNSQERYCLKSKKYIDKVASSISDAIDQYCHQ